MDAAERMRRYRARLGGDDEGYNAKRKPGPKPKGDLPTLAGASLEELIDEVSERLTGRRCDEFGWLHGLKCRGEYVVSIEIEAYESEDES